MAAPVHAAGQEQASGVAAAEDGRRRRAEVHGQDGRGKLQAVELSAAAGVAAVAVSVALRFADQAGNLQTSGLLAITPGVCSGVAVARESLPRTYSANVSSSNILRA